MMKEILADLGITKGGAMHWFSNLFLAALMLWFRMFFHYMGQYVTLKLWDCPVTDVEVEWYRIKLNYGFWNIYQELVVVFIGPFSNTILFFLMMKIVQISQAKILCFPKLLSKAFAWFGFFNIFDFILISIIDFASQDLTGDIFKLYNYFEQSGSTGFVGFFITFLVQFMTMMINMFLFYQHILFIHREAKIADIYLFISGKGRNYFIPEDNELSYRLLKHIYNEGKVNNNRILCNQI